MDPRRFTKGLLPTKRLRLHSELVCRLEALGAAWRPYRKFWANTGPGATIYNAVVRAAGAWNPSSQVDFIRDPGEKWLTQYVTKKGTRYKMTGDLRRLWKEDYNFSRGCKNAEIKKITNKRGNKLLSMKNTQEDAAYGNFPY